MVVIHGGGVFIADFNDSGKKRRKKVIFVRFHRIILNQSSYQRTFFIQLIVSFVAVITFWS